jgi:hypothetical protein
VTSLCACTITRPRVSGCGDCCNQCEQHCLYNTVETTVHLIVHIVLLMSYLRLYALAKIAFPSKMFLISSLKMRFLRFGNELKTSDILKM